jgi:membrane protease YdiL (CAAX protease family)
LNGQRKQADFTQEVPVPTSFDLAFAAFFAVGLTLLETFAFWPRVRPRMEANAPGVRPFVYRFGVASEWALALIVIAGWIVLRRPWSSLGLVSPAGWRVAVSLVLVLPLAWMIWKQRRVFATASPKLLDKLRPKLGHYTFMLPHDRAEYRWFNAVSVTAGFCEELLYRGFLTWVLRPWLGVWGAWAVSSALFGAAHAYLGREGIVKSTIGGVVFGGIAVLTGSIVPGMIVHALVDLQSGMVGYAVLSAEASAEGRTAPLSTATPASRAS